VLLWTKLPSFLAKSSLWKKHSFLLREKVCSCCNLSCDVRGCKENGSSYTLGGHGILV
jgi:hypothetical protein